MVADNVIEEGPLGRFTTPGLTEGGVMKRTVFFPSREDQKKKERKFTRKENRAWGEPEKFVRPKKKETREKFKKGACPEKP